MTKMATRFVVAIALLSAVQAMDMRGLKKRNKDYLQRTDQTKHTAFDEDKYLLSLGKVSRRHLLSMGLEENEENIAAAHRQLTYFNDTRWVEAEPWTDPEVTATSECPGSELYGSFGTSYICPLQTMKDCATEADEYASMDAQGNPLPTEGTWNVFPSAMRGNWDDADYWTIPIPMGKFIGEYEGMCENGDVFNTVSHPACIPRGVEVPFATLCVFNRIYKIDYNALWYIWYAWSEYSDSAELITRSATIESDGMGSTTALYQVRIFVPSPPAAVGSKRRSLQQDTTTDASTTFVEVE